MDFFESFKHYDEIGSPARIQCLKYMVIANMLMQSEINPFDSPETQSYQNHPEIAVLTGLVTAYQSRDIRAFEQILMEHGRAILEDDFLRDYIEELRFNIRTQTLATLIKTRGAPILSYETISETLGISPGELEGQLLSMILGGQIKGKLVSVSRQFHPEKDQKCPDELFCAAFSGLLGHVGNIKETLEVSLI